MLCISIDILRNTIFHSLWEVLIFTTVPKKTNILSINLKITRIPCLSKESASNEMTSSFTVKVLFCVCVGFFFFLSPVNWNTYYNLIIPKLAHIKVVLWNDFTVVRLHWMWRAKNLSHSEYNIHGICHLYIITRRIISVQIFSDKSCCYQSHITGKNCDIHWL